MKTLRAAFKKCIDFFFEFSPKIDENPSPKVRKTIFARKIDEKSLPGPLFWVKDRFLVDFWVPEGTYKLSKSYGAPGEIGFEARLFERIH